VPTFKQKEHIGRWVGSPEELGRAALIAHAAFERWGATDPPVDVDVDLGRGETVNYASTDELGLLSNLPAERLKPMTLRVGRPYGSPSATVGAANFPGPAIQIEVRGGDEAGVLGLASQLKRELQTGARRVGWYRQSLPLVCAPAFVAGGVVRMVVRQGWVIGSAQIALAILLLGVAYVTPSLEFVAPGGRTRWNRYARPLMAGIIALVIGIAGSALWDLIKQ
jgi:hypothetical protein